jgi:hypothetical protein
VVVGVLNDTIESKNFGCQLVSHSLRKYLDKVEGISEIKYFPFNKKIGSKEGIDLVIVNGEGSFGHREGKPDGFAKLSGAIKEYSKAGIPVYLVNFSFQLLSSRNPSKFIDVFKFCTKVAVREPISYFNLKKLGIENVELYPDLGVSYFDYKPEEKEFDIVFGLGAITKFFKKDNNAPFIRYGEIINKYSQKYRVGFLQFPGNPTSDLEKMKPFLSKDVKIIDGDFSNCYEAILKSKIVVTGRHHACVMALSAKTPFISFNSNMWKTEGNQVFYGPFEYFNFLDDKGLIVDKINKVLNNLDQYNSIIETSHKNLKPFFTGHLDCVFKNTKDVIQSNTVDFTFEKDIKGKFPDIDFKNYGF